MLRARMQGFAHQCGRRCDAAPAVAAIGIEQVDGERSADGDHQRGRSARMRAEQRQESVDAELARIGIGNAQTRKRGLCARDRDALETLRQRIEQANRQPRRNDTGEVGDVALRWQDRRARLRRIHAPVCRREHLAKTAIGMQWCALQPGVAEIEQPVHHPSAFVASPARTLTSPEWKAHSPPS